MKEVKVSTFISAVKIDMEEELATVLAEQIRQEQDNHIMSEMLVTMGWHKITVNDRHAIAAEWCTQNIRSPYRIFGSHWCFQDAKDAAWFGLKWC